MKPGPTLIDTLYRVSFRNEPIMNWKSNAGMREALMGARRFILDDGMSEFLGELGTAAFVGKSKAIYTRLCDSLRVSARLPHKSIWVEYNLRRCQARSQGLLGNRCKPEDMPKTEGVLLQQHPFLDTAIIMHLFSDVGEMDETGYRFYTFPVAYAWTVNEEVCPWVSPWGTQGNVGSEMATGMIGYRVPQVTITLKSPLLECWGKPESVIELIQEWTGCVRRVWALLATLNDLPAAITDIRQSKGFVAKGRYRKFLDHKTLTISIPQKSYTKVARNLIALARRRAHMVRGHFRVDWRNPPSKRCPWFLANGVHAWDTNNVCTICRGHRLVIHEHQRGDASLGFVTHDYNVTRNQKGV
jgi:hypothetical protein